MKIKIEINHSPATSLFEAFLNSRLDSRCGRVIYSLGADLRQRFFAILIDSQVEFWENDFVNLFSSKARGVGGGFGGDSTWEMLYTHTLSPRRGEAVNMTAVLALEKALNRNPFVCKGSRLYVGCSFKWLGLDVKCTSITREYVMEEKKMQDKHLVACSYKWEKVDGLSKPKLDRVFKITHNDLTPLGHKE